MANPSAIGDRIRAWRTSAGMSQKYLAAKVGYHRNTISNIENGKSHPSAENVIQLAHALGCTSNDLLSPAGHKPPKIHMSIDRKEYRFPTDEELRTKVFKPVLQLEDPYMYCRFVIDVNPDRVVGGGWHRLVLRSFADG